MRRRSPVERYLPTLYAAMALLLVAILLPTALRPPQPPPPSSAEFSPDAPPDEDSEIILGELNRGRSATAGAGTTTVGVGDSGPATLVKQVFKPGRQCFGTPPRQTESLYSAPCVPAWTERDNGGASYRGVTKNEVRVAAWHLLWPTSYEGPVPRQKPDVETAVDRTYRVIQAYLNQRFEFYGRTLQLVAMNEGSTNFGAQRREAAKAADQYGSFAAVVIGEPACEEFARRKLPCFGGQYPKFHYEDRAPYYWSWYSDTSHLRELMSEYICKKLAFKKAVHAGDPTFRERERKFGLVYPEYYPWNAVGQEFPAQLKRQCGVEIAEKIGYNWGNGEEQDPSQGQQAIATMVTRMRAAGVTTIIQGSEFFTTIVMTNSADSQGYFPEWLVYGGALDHAQAGRLFSQNQWQHAFGISGFELPAREEETDCWRAYKEVDPISDPDVNICRWQFPTLLQVANAIQLAGPKLTAETFRNGLWSMGKRFYPEPWAIGGGFGPGDYAYMDNVMEIWWDPQAQDPMDRQSLGAYRHPNNGKRYRLGEFTSELKVFQEGITEAPRSSSP